MSKFYRVFCLKSYSLSSVIYYFEINASWHFNLVGLYINGQRCISGLFTVERTQRSELFSWWTFIDLPKQVSTISCCVAVVLLTERSDKTLFGISKRFMTLDSRQCTVSGQSVYSQWPVSVQSVASQCTVSVQSVYSQCTVSIQSVARDYLLLRFNPLNAELTL